MAWFFKCPSIFIYTKLLSNTVYRLNQYALEGREDLVSKMTWLQNALGFFWPLQVGIVLGIKRPQNFRVEMNLRHHESSLLSCTGNPSTGGFTSTPVIIQWQEHHLHMKQPLSFNQCLLLTYVELKDASVTSRHWLFFFFLEINIE